MEATGSLGRGDFMHKDTRWAQQIISMQEKDGKWFFSIRPLALPGGRLQRSRRFGGWNIWAIQYQKACSYMNNCLVGQAEVPDRREKILDWEIFVSLMLTAWSRRFSDGYPAANKVAGQWTEGLLIIRVFTKYPFW